MPPNFRFLGLCQRFMHILNVLIKSLLVMEHHVSERKS